MDEAVASDGKFSMVQSTRVNLALARGAAVVGATFVAAADDASSVWCSAQGRMGCWHCWATRLVWSSMSTSALS